MLLERAKQYADDVVSGNEKTTFEVKKQCEWFLRDCSRQRNDDYPYYLDTDFIDKVEGILSLLHYATGIGVVGLNIMEGLADFQAFFLVNVFGWRLKEDKKRYRYRRVILFIPRKNGKTFICALILIILMLTEDDYSEFYSICIDRDLAGIVKSTISKILSASPHISKYFTVPRTLSGRTVCSLTHSIYQPRTSQANSNNAIQPSAFIADEIGAFKERSNIEAMESGQLSVRNPLEFELTTAYAEDQSIMLEELDYLKKLYKGLEQDERLFALLYYAPEEHLWDDEGIEIANPLRIPHNYDLIRDRREKALAIPSKREEYLTKNVNHFVPTNAGESFIELDRLRKCVNVRGSFDWNDKDVYLGLDLAQTNDNTSVSMVAYEDGMIFAKSWAFIPADRIDEKNRRERTDYNRFIQEGDCFACGEEVVSYAYIEKFVSELEGKYGVRIQSIGFDRYNCISTAEKLETEGYTMVEVKQHSSVLHAPTKLLQESILERTFSYDGSKLYEINFQNARCTLDTNLNMYVNKKKSTGKVDMVVSTIIAICLLQQRELLGSDFVCQCG